MIRVSSQKREISAEEFLSMSLIMIRKSIGPRTVPWGTPLRTLDGVDLTPFARMCCSLFDKKLCRNIPRFPVSPISLSLWERIPMSTLSKAFENQDRLCQHCFHPLGIVTLQELGKTAPLESESMLVRIQLFLDFQMVHYYLPYNSLQSLH